MANLGNIFGQGFQGLGGLQQQQQLAQQQLTSNAIAVPWTNAGNSNTQTLTVHYDFEADAWAYTQGAEKRTREAGEIAPGTNAEWLDRRVNEVRVKL